MALPEKFSLSKNLYDVTFASMRVRSPALTGFKIAGCLFFLGFAGLAGIAGVAMKIGGYICNLISQDVSPGGKLILGAGVLLLPMIPLYLAAKSGRARALQARISKVRLMRVYSNRFAVRTRAKLLRRLQAITLSGIDTMTGTEFEEYLLIVLTYRGWIVERIGGSGDLGADLIAQKEDSRCVIQAKRYNEPVSRRAVSDAVAAMAQYRCNASMVITNNVFTDGAIELAKANACELVSRNMLADWIAEFQGT